MIPGSPYYPAELESDVLAADGRVTTVRPIVPTDASALRSFDEALSPDTVYMRFFSPRGPLSDAQVERFVTVDYLDRMALVALAGGEIAAIARYDRAPASSDAEVAFVVRDDQQGRGLATVLLEHLAAAASARGVRRFLADTLSANNKMLRVFRETGFEEHASFASGVVRVVMSLDPTPPYLESVRERERSAVIASLRPFLLPASLAVVGAAHTEEAVASRLIANLVAGGFAGPVYLVDAGGNQVAGRVVYRSIGDLPAPVDLALIAGPDVDLAAAVDDCGLRGIGGVAVLSTDAQTEEVEVLPDRRLAAIAHRRGMRVIGPNCIGLVNTLTAVSMNATLAPLLPPTGDIAALSSRSGAHGMAVLNEMTRRDLGVSAFVSVGDGNDISAGDLLLHWEQDANTDVILLCLESSQFSASLRSTAESVAHKKPIIALTVPGPGTTTVMKGPQCDAAATSGAPEDDLLRQAGVIPVHTSEELLDVAEVLSNQPLPDGAGVAVLGAFGAPGIVAVEACERLGLVVPGLSTRNQKRLRLLLPAQASVSNPVGWAASASTADYRMALEIILDDEAVDAVIVSFSPPAGVGGDDLALAEASVAAAVTSAAAAVTSAAAAATKPIVASLPVTSRTSAALRQGGIRVPLFARFESAVLALSRIAAYAAWRSKAAPAQDLSEMGPWPPPAGTSRPESGLPRRRLG